MSRPDERRGPDVGYYVYGIVPADVRLGTGTEGIGDPPAPVELVPHADIAAVVSPVPIDKPIGEPADLLAHARLLDRIAADAAVLPVRFGAVVASRAAVVDELLAGDRDDFAAALAGLRGHAEYVVQAQFVERTVLAEIVSETPEIEGLRDEIRGQPEGAARGLELRLGELVGEAIETRRALATRELIDSLAPVSAASAVRPPSHELDAAHVAFLVETAHGSEFENVVESVARRWPGYATVRMLGPIAPYDFVATLPDAATTRG